MGMSKALGTEHPVKKKGTEELVQWFEKLKPEP